MDGVSLAFGTVVMTFSKYLRNCLQGFSRKKRQSFKRKSKPFPFSEAVGYTP
jgi:hypothetical protein